MSRAMSSSLASDPGWALGGGIELLRLTGEIQQNGNVPLSKLQSSLRTKKKCGEKKKGPD